MNDKTFLQMKAYNYIKEQILENKLEKDVLYSETKLSQEIGVSRTPMREALQCLSQDGYINILPSRGFTLRQLSERDMLETIQVRCAIEGFCTYLIASDVAAGMTRGEKLLNDLAFTVNAMKKALKMDDGYQTFLQNDHEFHLLLVNYADNQEFTQVYQKLMYQIQLTSVSALAVAGRAEETLAEHERFLEFLKNGDKNAAYDALVEHLTMPERMHVAKG